MSKIIYVGGRRRGMKSFKNWLEYRLKATFRKPSVYDSVFDKDEADLMERVIAIGYVLLDDEYSYKICREYDERTLVVQFPKKLLEHHTFVPSLLEALSNL